MPNPTAVTAEISSLYRFPVKSMTGEEFHAEEVIERGIIRDRGYALVDDESRIVIISHGDKGTVEPAE